MMKQRRANEIIEKTCNLGRLNLGVSIIFADLEVLIWERKKEKSGIEIMWWLMGWRRKVFHPGQRRKKTGEDGGMYFVFVWVLIFYLCINKGLRSVLKESAKGFDSMFVKRVFGKEYKEG